MATQAVIDAEANLRKARDEARHLRVNEAKATLKQVRQTAKALRKELYEIVAEVKESELATTAARAELEAIDETIARLRAPSEDPLDEPADRDEASIAELRAYREEVGKKFTAAQQKGARRMRGIEIQGQLIQLGYTARNLANEIENAGEKGWRGGVSPVG
jgi:hypothetical protein